MPDARHRDSIGTRALFWEDYRPGMEWLTPGRTITATDIALWGRYAGGSAYLAEADEGGCLLPQAAFAIATGLEQRLGLKEGTGIAFLSARFDCPRPIQAGVTLRVRQRLVGTVPTRNPGCGLVRFAVRLEDRGGVAYQEGEWLLMVRRRPGAAGGETGGSKARASEDAACSGTTLYSPFRAITQADILYGSQLAADYNPVHTDALCARAAGFAGPILQGPAGAAIAAGLLSRLLAAEGERAEVLAIDWTFHKPILAGMTVRLEVGRIADPSRSGRETFNLVLVDRDREKLQSGNWTVQFHQQVPRP
ncbi:MAG: hypothetical protein M9895_02470 [Aquamicrobium sp.]|uniref:MaoC/PaaZ C-terminal domain-containing protein n=1 Tax=Aquamicrobium sp. TaxID=1872579 RepID=UPI00349F0374|nr:hypothetical protein [Aquamicrobium sp.]MCO5159257.1 hypothetical protein [Aquamicrobium sp.]